MTKQVTATVDGQFIWFGPVLHHVPYAGYGGVLLKESIVRPIRDSGFWDNLSCLQQPGIEYQVNYARQLVGWRLVTNLTNAGSLNGFDPAGDICANVYVFAEDQQQLSRAAPAR